jgi:hypothetical protein
MSPLYSLHLLQDEGRVQTLPTHPRVRLITPSRSGHDIYIDEPAEPVSLFLL